MPKPEATERLTPGARILEIVCRGKHKRGGPACQMTCGVQVRGILDIFACESEALRSERDAAQEAFLRGAKSWSNYHDQSAAAAGQAETERVARAATSDAFRAALSNVGELLRKIPQQNFLHADRYDDGNFHKLHLWDDKGNTYDVFVPLEKHLQRGEEYWKQFGEPSAGATAPSGDALSSSPLGGQDGRIEKSRESGDAHPQITLGSPQPRQGFASDLIETGDALAALKAEVRPVLTGDELRRLCYEKCGLHPAWMQSRWQKLADAIIERLAAPPAVKRDAGE